MDRLVAPVYVTFPDKSTFVILLNCRATCSTSRMMPCLAEELMCQILTRGESLGYVASTKNSTLIVCSPAPRAIDLHS